MGLTEVLIRVLSFLQLGKTLHISTTNHLTEWRDRSTDDTDAMTQLCVRTPVRRQKELAVSPQTAWATVTASCQLDCHVWVDVAVAAHTL